MAKTIALSIEIDGLSDITKQVVGLEQELKQLNAELKNAEVGSDAYIDLRNQIAATKEQLSQAKKEQKDFIKSAEATKQAEGSYYQLNQQLVDLKKAYKNLSAAERESAKGTEMLNKINKLDKELKDIDGSIGQFQRNVGNYPKTFQIINRSLIRTIPGFEAFSDTLKDAEGNINLFGKALIGGFVAFQGAKLIGQAMKQLDEFISKINETKETVAEFSGAYGEDLNKMTAQTKALAETFNTDAKSISEAAHALSKSMGIGFDEALTRLEGALVEGRGNADDYLKTITEYPEVFKDAGNGITEFSERNKQLLGTNKALAESQVNVASRLQGLNDGFKSAKNTITTGLLLVFAQIIDVLKPVGAAFSNLWSSLSELFSVFKVAGKEGSLFGAIIENAIMRPIRILSGVLTIAADVLVYFVNGIKDFIAQSPFLQNIFEIIGKGAERIQFVFSNLPAIFAGVVESVKQMGKGIAAFFEDLFLQSQIAYNRIKGAFGADVDDILKDLRAKRAQLKAEGKSIGEAFNEGFNDAKNAAQKKAAEEERRNQQIEAEKARKAQENINNKALTEQAQAQREAAKKLAEERKKYAEQEEKEARARIALLADLQARLIEEQIKNIKEGKERELAELENETTARIDTLNKQYDALKLAAEQREKELAETFGQASEELAQTRAENEKLLAQVQEQQAKIRTEIEAQEATKRKEINDSYRTEELKKAQDQADKLRQFRDEALSSELEFIDNIGQQRELKNQETLNRLLIQEEDAKKREGLIRKAEEERILAEIEIIRNKQQALTDQEEFLKSQADAGIEIKQEEYDAILMARQELNTKLSEFELQQTEIIRSESEKQLAIRQKQFEDIAGYAQQGLQIIETVVSSINARAEADVEGQLERSQERQDSLNAEIENAVGLRKKYLEQQLANEVQAQEQLAKKQEEIQKRAAVREKAIALTQSIIQGLLAVSKAISSAPFPANVPAIILTTAQSAAQSAAIAAKQFEDGGMIIGPSHSNGGVPFTVQGKAGFEAEGGEFIVNRRATSKFLPVLSAINKFASGGIIGAPNVSGIGGNTNMLRAINERSAAISNQVLESKVYLVTDELHRDTAEGERIKKKVTLR